MKSHKISFLTIVAIVFFFIGICQAQLKVVSPNGGETLKPGSIFLIRWSGIATTEKVDLDYSTDLGATWIAIISQATGLQYSWTVPNTLSTTCLLRATLPGRVVRDSALFDSIRHATSPYFGFGWSPDSRYIAFAGVPADLLLTSDLSKYYSFTTDAAITLTFSPDSKRILYRGYNYPAQMVDLPTKTVLRQYLIPVVRNVLWNPAGGSFMSIGSDLLNWDADSVRVLDTLKERPYSDSRTDQWSPDGKRFAGIPGYQAYNNFARIYDPATGDSLLYLPGDSDGMTDIRYDHKGDRLLTIGIDSTIRIWDASTGMLLHRIVQQNLDNAKVRWSADDKFIAAGLFDADSVMIWDASSGLLARVLHFYPYAPFSLDWSPNGKWLAIASGDLIFFFDEATGDLIQTLHDPDNVIANVEVAMQWSPDSTRLAGGDGRVKIWFIDPRAAERDTSDNKWTIGNISPKHFTLRIGSDSAYTGNTVDLPVILTDPGAAFAQGADSVSANYHYNATLLAPLAPTSSGTIASGLHNGSFTFPVTSATDSILGYLHFIAGLGNAVSTVMHIDSSSSNTPNAILDNEDGTFILLGICAQGGNRLLNPNGTASLILPKNFIDGSAITAKVLICENGVTKISLVDMLGRKMKVFLDEEIGIGEHSVQLDFTDITSGKYLIVLQTPARYLSQPLEVIR